MRWMLYPPATNSNNTMTSARKTTVVATCLGSRGFSVTFRTNSPSLTLKVIVRTVKTCQSNNTPTFTYHGTNRLFTTGNPRKLCSHHKEVVQPFLSTTVIHTYSMRVDSPGLPLFQKLSDKCTKNSSEPTAMYSSRSWMHATMRSSYKSPPIGVSYSLDRHDRLWIQVSQL